MTLRFAINTEPPQPEPVWYAEMRERERAFNALHPRCPGCGSEDTTASIIASISEPVSVGGGVCHDCGQEFEIRVQLS